MPYLFITTYASSLLRLPVCRCLARAAGALLQLLRLQASLQGELHALGVRALTTGFVTSCFDWLQATEFNSLLHEKTRVLSKQVLNYVSVACSRNNCLRKQQCGSAEPVYVAVVQGALKPTAYCKLWVCMVSHTCTYKYRVLLILWKLTVTHAGTQQLFCVSACTPLRLCADSHAACCTLYGLDATSSIAWVDNATSCNRLQSKSTADW